MEPFAQDLVAAITSRHDRIRELATEIVESTPEMRGRYSAEELDQLLHGFETMLLEAVEERGDTARTIILETAVPAMVADGQSPASLARAVVPFAILLTDELLPEVGEGREAARAWLGHFFGEYVRDVVAAASEAGAGRG